jgi:hypothetical protein
LIDQSIASVCGVILTGSAKLIDRCLTDTGQRLKRIQSSVTLGLIAVESIGVFV